MSSEIKERIAERMIAITHLRRILTNTDLLLMYMQCFSDVAPLFRMSLIVRGIREEIKALESEVEELKKELEGGGG